MISLRTIRTVDTFATHIDEVTKSMFAKWGAEEIYMTPMQTSIYVLFFRNSHLWDSVFLLLSNNRIHGAEFLFRMLLEGVITFDWCHRDIDSRALRFRLTTFESTLDYIRKTNSNDIIIKKEEERLLKAIESLKSKGVSSLPKLLDMAKELEIAEKDVLLRWYKYLSKKIHGVYEEWNEYEFPPHKINYEGDQKAFLQRCYHLKAITSFLQMRNIMVMSIICEPLAFVKDEEIQSEWAKVYLHFVKDKKYIST